MIQKKIALGILITLVVSLSLIVNISCSGSDDWAVKIDEDVISLDDFYQYYYIQNKLMGLEREDVDKMSDNPMFAQHPFINKNRFLDFLVSRRLLYMRALSDDDIDQDNLQALMELQQMQAAANYYLLMKLKDDIKVTDDEANQFYAANPKVFKGVAIDENVIKQIKQRIFMKKLEQKSQEFIMNLIAESKVNREGFKNHLKSKSKTATEENVETADPDASAPATPAKGADKAGATNQAPAPAGTQ